jgi:hypothetical protein
MQNRGSVQGITCSAGFATKLFKAAGANLQFIPLNQGFTILFTFFHPL